MAFSYEKILNWHFDEVVEGYTTKDSIIYALSLGFGFNPSDPDELKYVYENGLQTFPTMPVVLGHPGPWMTNPETGIDVVKVLHGEQHLEIHKALPAAGTIVAQNKVVDVVDKGADKGALIISERKLYEQTSGDLLCTQTSVIFARGNGGFGGPVTALLYRLNGDYNPLHADPAFAKKAGFKAPILHGLASYGVAARAVLKSLEPADSSRLNSFGLRFSAPVYPGETIRTEVWRDGNEVSFRARVLERDVIALNNGKAIIN